MQTKNLFKFATVLAAAGCLCGPARAPAIDIPNTQPAAIDQPQVNAVLLPVGSLTPFQDSDHNFDAFGFLDTGSSGIVIDQPTADLVHLPTDPGVTFSDIGVGGSTLFNVSQPIDIRLAPPTDPDAGDITKIQTVYNQATSSVRTQLGPNNVAVDPFGDPVRVYGMPLMMGKTVVLDPKPLNNPDILQAALHTFIYNPGTPFNPATADTNPGIPATNLHVALSYASFDRFTQTDPSTASPPTTAHNPFIGPDPLAKLPPVSPGIRPSGVAAGPPPVSVDFQGLHAEGSFLLDTGAAASFISTNLAAQLHVRYSPNVDAANPVLETFDPNNPSAPGTLIANQFQLPILGIGGAATIPGFFLDDLVLHTIEGGLLDSNPNNLRFFGAPVLVQDITVEDQMTHQMLTLDGVFGMNFLMLSISLDLALPSSISLDLGLASDNPFNWITFDEPNGILGLDIPIANVPEPGSLVLAASGVLVLMGYGGRRRLRARVSRR